MAPPTSHSAGLVGRDQELETLDRALSELADGGGGSLFLVGDPGMGKTALLEATLVEAERRGLSVMSGKAWPLDAGLAYAPILQALGRWLRELPDERRVRLVSGLSELTRLFGELELPPAPSLGDAALEKTRLFEAVARLLERAAEDQPVVLAIDDLQFADASSIELSHYLLRRLFDARFLMLCTLRGPAAEGPSSEFLRYAELAGAAKVLALGPLDARAQRELSQRLLDSQSLSDELVELIVRRSAGVPFFVEAIVQSLLRDEQLTCVAGQWRPGPRAGTALPRVACQLIVAVVDHLDTEQRRVLDHLAVGGAELSFETLEAACPIGRAALVDALNGLAAHHLIRESRTSGPSSTYSIRLPLAQEVLYEALSEVDRRAAHRRFLSAAAAIRVDAALARHIVGAGVGDGDSETAIDTLLAAADGARTRYAHDEAAKWYSAALALAKETNRTVDWTRLLESLGDAQSAMGERERAVQSWSEALELADGAGEVNRAASVRGKLALELWGLGRLDESMAVLRTGIAQLETAGPSGALARLYGVSIVNALRLGDIAWVRDKAALLSTWEHEDAAVAFEIAMARANELLARGQLERAFEAVGVAREKARSVADQVRVGRLMVFMGIALGRIDDACLSEYRELTQTASVPSLEMPYSFLLGVRALYLGDLVGATDQFEEAVFESRFARSPRRVLGASAFLATTLAFRGRFEEAERTLVEVESTVHLMPDDLHVSSIYQMARAALAVERGEPDDARSAAAMMSKPGDETPLEQLIAAEAWLVSGELERCERVMEVMEPACGEIDYALAGAQRMRGRLSLARGHKTRGRDHLRSALELFEPTGMAFFTARVKLELAELEATPSAAAVSAAKQSLEAFERADSQHWQERARALLRRHGEVGRRQTPSRKDRPLSDRELQVARLAARGLTNAEIGRELFISPHTAATHMKRILSRAGVNNRAALARWLREADLDDGV